MDAQRCADQFTSSILRYPICSFLVNPLWFSFLVTATIMVIVFAMYAEESRCKTAFWIYLFVMAAIFINNQLMIKSFRNELMTDTERNLCEALALGPPDPTTDAADMLGLQKINSTDDDAGSSSGPSMVVGLL